MEGRYHADFWERLLNEGLQALFHFPGLKPSLKVGVNPITFEFNEYLKNQEQTNYS